MLAKRIPRPNGLSKLTNAQLQQIAVEMFRPKFSYISEVTLPDDLDDPEEVTLPDDLDDPKDITLQEDFYEPEEVTLPDDLDEPKVNLVQNGKRIMTEIIGSKLDVKVLCKKLGCGGKIKNNIIYLQGDHRDVVKALMT
jgi:hypothetical protein